MNSLFDCCFPKHEGDFVMNEGKDFKDNAVLKFNSEGAYYKQSIDHNLKGFEGSSNQPKLGYCFPLSPNEVTNRGELSKKGEKPKTKDVIQLLPYEKEGLDKEEDDEDKERDALQFNQQLQFDKQSERSQSHCSMRSEQSTEIFLNRTISPEDIQAGPKLVIKEVEGNQLGEEKEIHINAAGMIRGARKANDGVALFGPHLTDQFGKCINDLVIGSNLKDIGHHLCVIYYRKELKKYFIRIYKDQLSNGLSVLLIKIKGTYPIIRTELFMIGDLFFVIKIEGNELKLTKLSCKRSPEELNHSYSIAQSPVTVGRDKTCELSFPSDKAFSKVHCTFFYSKEKKEWAIKDGIDNKPSTNGLWVIPKHSLEVFDKMTFKIMGCSKFIINLSPN